VYAVDDDLLSVAEEFDLFILGVGCCIGRYQHDRDFFERLIGSERDCPLWRQSDSHQKETEFLKSLACQALGGDGGWFDEDVDVEARNGRAEDARINRVGKHARPKFNLLLVGLGLFLPSLDDRNFAAAGDRDIPCTMQEPPSLERRHGSWC
jgi:hypothetical protein